MADDSEIRDISRRTFNGLNTVSTIDMVCAEIFHVIAKDAMGV